MASKNYKMIQNLVTGVTAASIEKREPKSYIMMAAYTAVKSMMGPPHGITIEEAEQIFRDTEKAIEWHNPQAELKFP